MLSNVKKLLFYGHKNIYLVIFIMEWMDHMSRKIEIDISGAEEIVC